MKARTEVSMTLVKDILSRTVQIQKLNAEIEELKSAAQSGRPAGWARWAWIVITHARGTEEYLQDNCDNTQAHRDAVAEVEDLVEEVETIRVEMLSGDVQYEKSQFGPNDGDDCPRALTRWEELEHDMIDKTARAHGVRARLVTGQQLVEYHRVLHHLYIGLGVTTREKKGVSG